MAAGGNRSEAPGTIRAVPAEVEDPTWERLEDQLGIDPFTASDDVYFPVTLGDFIAFYQDAAAA